RPASTTWSMPCRPSSTPAPCRRRPIPSSSRSSCGRSCTGSPRCSSASPASPGPTVTPWSTTSSTPACEVSTPAPAGEGGGDLLVELAGGLGALGDAGHAHLSVLGQGTEQVQGDAGGRGRVVGQALAIDLGDDVGGGGAHQRLVLQVVGGDVRTRPSSGDELSGRRVVDPTGHEPRHPERVGG